jgi:hypothetical protein
MRFTNASELAYHPLMLRFFFPPTLTRKQYFLRWLVCFGVLCVVFFLFVAALIRGTFYFLSVYALWAYWIFGLAMPRLRSADKVPWLALLIAVPLINLAMFVYLFAVPDRITSISASSASLP